MKNQDSFLYKKLQDHPVAPLQGFEKFIVGELPVQRIEVVGLLKRMLNNQEPSRIQVIIGPNGNGKTLLDNALKVQATEINLQKNSNIPNPRFDVLFSHITFNSTNPTLFGIELAKNLQRSIYEPPEVTYAVIAAKIVTDFANNYLAPLYLRVVGILPRFLLKQALEKYQYILTGFLTENDYQSFSATLDSVLVELSQRITSPTMKREFYKYADRKEISSFMKDYFKSDSRSISVKQLNASLYDDFRVNQGTAQPLDTIKAIASVARDVGCKVLVLMVDDFNQDEPPKILLPIAEQLGAFENPKLLFVINALAIKWKKMMSDSEDLSAKQKLQDFGNPINVKSPSKADLIALFDRLLGLMNEELIDYEMAIKINDNLKKKLLANCPTGSYREATKYIIDELDRYKASA